MKSRQYYLETIRKMELLLRKQFGVMKLILFGSVAREDNTIGSDVDILVETATPDPFLLLDLKEFLSHEIGQSVDIVRMHKNINPYLMAQINKDGIRVF